MRKDEMRDKNKRATRVYASVNEDCERIFNKAGRFSHKLCIAVVAANGLGDGLIFAMLANNLKKNGHTVTLYSTMLGPLSAWFSTLEIRPFPPTQSIKETFDAFDLTIGEDHSIVQPYQAELKNCVILKKSLFNRNKSMVDNLFNLCRRLFHLSNVTDLNGITLPAHNKGAKHRQYQDRVIIHPESGDTAKNWPPHKFITLARKLKQKDYEPIFVMAPSEREHWQTLIKDEFEIPLFNTLDDAALYIYESGWMIGNDSGIGHLASCLDLPTLTLFRVKSKGQLWRPGWKNNRTIAPLWRIPGKKGRRLWKQLLSVNRVLNAFKNMVSSS